MLRNGTYQYLSCLPFYSNFPWIRRTRQNFPTIADLDINVPRLLFVFSTLCVGQLVPLYFKPSRLKGINPSVLSVMRYFHPPCQVINPSRLDSNDHSSPQISNLLSSSKPKRIALFLRLKIVKHFHDDSRSKSQPSATTIAKRKRAKYAHVRPPPPLANELAMMQFADGGSLESHIKRVMEAQAKATAGSGGLNVGIADVYRDEKGGIWWDADEELEYAHLLDGLDREKAEREVEETFWEDFGGQESHLEHTTRGGMSAINGRRPSVSSSVDSDLDPKYLLPSPESDSYPTFTSGTLNDRVLVSSRVGDETLSLLSRPSRQAPHLFKPILLGDMEAFGKNGPRYDDTLSVRVHPGGNVQVVKPTRRRRLLPPLDIVTLESRLPNTEDELQTLRKEFIESSFTPSFPTFATDVTPSLDPSSVSSQSSCSGATKRSSSTLRALFTRKSS